MMEVVNADILPCQDIDDRRSVDLAIAIDQAIDGRVGSFNVLRQNNAK